MLPPIAGGNPVRPDSGVDSSSSHRRTGLHGIFGIIPIANDAFIQCALIQFSVPAVSAGFSVLRRLGRPDFPERQAAKRAVFAKTGRLAADIALFGVQCQNDFAGGNALKPAAAHL